MDAELARVLDENAATIARLREQLRSTLRVIPFVGAGVSVPFGCPGWGAFLRGVADRLALRREIDDLLAADEYEAAAGRLLDSYGPSGFLGEVARSFGSHALGDRRLDGVLTLLPELTSGPVVTTNFDGLVERAFEQAGRRLEVLLGGAVDTAGRFLALNRPFLLKIHGNAEERTGRVFAREEYDAHYGPREGVDAARPPRPLVALLRRLMMGTPLLFLGCSLTKDRTLDVLERAHRDAGHSLTHFTFLQSPATAAAVADRLRFLSRHGIEPVWYPKDRHSLIEAVLRHLLESGRDPRRAVSPPAEAEARVEARIRELTGIVVGRQAELEALDTTVRDQPRRVHVVAAEAGFGKSALLAAWLERRRAGGDAVAAHFFSRRDGITAPGEAFASLVRQVRRLAGRADADSVPPTASRDALYRELSQWAAAKPTPIIVVIDALDEAEGPLRRPGPADLPERVTIVVSGRAARDETPPDLAEWLDRGVRFDLGPLPPAAVTAWLAATDVPALKTLSSDGPLVARMADLAGGQPLYLRHLIDELAREATRGVPPAQVLSRTPKGFEQYVEDHLRALLTDRRALGAVRTRKLFAVLCAARGPMPDEELQAMTGTSALELPWRVTRWFVSVRDDEARLTHRFGHDGLARLFSARLSAALTAARRTILAHCAKWRANGSRYALRHYADHLAEQEARDRLISLARDEAFRSAQLRAFPDEPDLTLRPLERALRLAMEAGDMPTAGELLVRSARQAAQLTLAQSPLEAARDGQLERALRLADLCAVGERALWLLLLAGQRADLGRPDEARRIITRLDGGAVPKLHGWRGRLAILLLLEIRELDPEAFQRLVDKMLKYEEVISAPNDPDPRIEDVAVVLRERGALDAAREACARWGPHGDWSFATAFARAGRLEEVDALLRRVRTRRLQEAHLDLATTLVEIGALEAARIELGRAIDEVEQDSDETFTFYRERLRAQQAAIELAVGSDAGEATLASISVPEHHAWGLALAARLTAGSDHARVELLARAEVIVHDLQPTAKRVKTLQRIAEECVLIDPARCRRLVTEAAALAGSLSDDDWKKESSLAPALEIWSGLARLAAQLGDIGLALQLVANIPGVYAFMSERVIAEIGAMEVRRGDAEGALARLRGWLKEHAKPPGEPERWVEAQVLMPWILATLEHGRRARAREIAAALLVVEAKEDAGHVDRACGELVDALIAAGRPEDGIAVTDLIHDDFSRRYHRSEVGVAQARRGNVTAARQIVAALSDQSFVLKDPVFRAIAEALAARGDLAAAETAIAQMDSWRSEFTAASAALIAPVARKEGQSAALTQLSRVRSQSEETAAAAVADIVEATTPQIDLVPLENFLGTLGQPIARVIGWAALGRGLARIGQRENALLTFRRAAAEAALAEANARRQDEQRRHRSRETATPWRKLAIAAHRAGLGDVGDEALRKMHGVEAYEQDWDDNELELVRAIVADGHVARAFAAARTMDRFGSEASALTAISASGHPLPEGFLDHVEDSWQRRVDRESWVPWFAMILARAGQRQRLIELLDDRPRDLPTALALCGALGRLDPSRAGDLARAMVAAAGSAPSAQLGPRATGAPGTT